MPKTLSIIRDEHRTIAAILDGMEHLVRDIRVRGKRIDPRVFHAMIYYLDTFAERVHHPREDQFLFALMRRSGLPAYGLIAQLEREHEGGADMLRRLAQAMIRYEEGGDTEFPAFEREVAQFIERYREHMRKEEEQLFPLALETLSAEDWATIDAAFEQNRDPLAAARDDHTDFDKLFTHIVNIAPPPVGVGPPAERG